MRIDFDKVKGIAFDLDGTLVDSMGIWKDIDIEFLGRYGYEIPDGLPEAIEGMSFTETAIYFQQRFRLELSVEEIKEIWNRMAFDMYAARVALKPGVREFLPFLQRKKIPLAIASSNSRTLIEAVLKAHHIEGYFQAIVTACDVRAGKPAPDVYLKAAQLLGAEPKGCLVFEDVPAGIRSARAAGMAVYAVEDAYSDHLMETKRALADGWIKSYTELMPKEELCFG